MSYHTPDSFLRSVNLFLESSSFFVVRGSAALPVPPFFKEKRQIKPVVFFAFIVQFKIIFQNSMICF